MKKTIGIFIFATMLTMLLGGCGTKGNNENVDSGNTDVDIKEIHAKIKKEFGEAYIPDTEIEKDVLEDVMGIDMNNVKDYIAESPMISVNVDMFIAVESKEDKGDLVESDLTDYRDYMVNNAVMYPMNIAKVNASKVVKYGDYVFFIMIGEYDSRDDVTEEQALIFAKEQVDKAEKIIDSFFK